MNKKLIASFVLSLGVAFASLTASAAVADFHVKNGVKCVSCHNTAQPKPGAKVSADQCLKCHQSYKVLADKTKNLTPNPHHSHLGKVRCSDCHSGHQQSRLMCNDCHKFDMTPK